MVRIVLRTSRDGTDLLEFTISDALSEYSLNNPLQLWIDLLAIHSLLRSCSCITVDSLGCARTKLEFMLKRNGERTYR